MTGETLQGAMTSLMQDDQVVCASRYLKKKLSQDVKTMMIFRQSTKMGKDPFSKMILVASSEDYQDGIKFLDDIIGVYRKHFLPGEAFLLQAKARFVTDSAQDYDSAIDAIRQALDLAPTNFALHDSQAQIRKKQMKNMMRSMYDMSRETWCDAFDAGTLAIADFIKAQELYDKTKSTYLSDYPDYGDITLSKSPGLFGEVETSLAITELLLESLCISEQDQSNMRSFLQLQNIRVEYIFEKKEIFTHDKIIPFIANLHGQIMKGMDKIIKNLDSRSWGGHFNELKELKKHTEKFEKLFFVSYFEDLYDQLCAANTDPGEKIDLVEKYIEIHQLKSLIFVKSQNTGHLAWLILIIQKFQKIIRDNGLTTKNSVKLAILNIDMTSKSHDLLKFEEAQKFSLDLAKREDDSYENYFFYLLMFLGDKAHGVDSANDMYDESCIVRCVKKIQEIKEAKSWKTLEGETKYDHHDYLFYLTTKSGFERVNHFDHIMDHRLPDAAIIDGTIVDNLIEMELPEGATVKIRPSRRPYFIKNLNTKYVTFELVFALNGLIAWNVKAKHSDRENFKDYIQENNERKLERKIENKSDQIHPSPEEPPWERTRHLHPSGEDPLNQMKALENIQKRMDLNADKSSISKPTSHTRAVTEQQTASISTRRGQNSLAPRKQQHQFGQNNSQQRPANRPSQQPIHRFQAQSQQPSQAPRQTHRPVRPPMPQQQPMLQHSNQYETDFPALGSSQRPAQPQQTTTRSQKNPKNSSKSMRK